MNQARSIGVAPRASALRPSVLAAILVAVVVVAPIDANDSRVRLGETLAGAEREKASASGPASSLSPRALALRCGLVLLVTGCLAAGVLILRRRRRGGASSGDVAIRVVARKPVAPRHTLLVVEVFGERLVLGISGDRMTTLTVQSPTGADESQAKRHSAPMTMHAPTNGRESRPSHENPEAAPPSTESRARDSNGVWAGESALTRRLRESTRDDGSRQLERLFSREDAFEDRAQLRPHELEPYRRSVDRLKSLLRDDGGLNTPDDPRPRGPKP